MTRKYEHAYTTHKLWRLHFVPTNPSYVCIDFGASPVCMCGVRYAVHLSGSSASIVCIARQELSSKRVNDVILLLIFFRQFLPNWQIPSAKRHTLLGFPAQLCGVGHFSSLFGGEYAVCRLNAHKLFAAFTFDHFKCPKRVKLTAWTIHRNRKKRCAQCACNNSSISGSHKAKKCNKQKVDSCVWERENVSGCVDCGLLDKIPVDSCVLGNRECGRKGEREENTNSKLNDENKNRQRKENCATKSLCNLRRCSIGSAAAAPTNRTNFGNLVLLIV